uniref:Uncharacterized protein n=1 Tax=Aegilops tauschii TaxID=37682 RepID=M8BAM8_AEGTA
MISVRLNRGRHTTTRARRRTHNKIEVRLPSNRAVDGFLGLYDRDIAIVTSFDFLPNVCPINLDCPLERYDLESVVAFGRAFKSGQLMSKHLQQTTPYPISDDGVPRKVLFPLFTEAALGASLTCSGNFCGMIHKEDTYEIWSLPPSLLRQRLMHFGVLKKGDEDTDDAGFMRNINLLKSMGYPTPPPLMLEVNGKLLNTFEEDFGEVSAWEGYDCNLMCRCAEYVWHKLPRKVFTDISRRVLSQLFHSKIEVFLSPNQRADGRLELYHLNHNIAIISVEKSFLAARPENIFYTVEKPSKNAVAIGREAAEGLLLATLGEVTDMPHMCSPGELDCGDLKLSTCKIKKVGIGGPLINSDDGSLVGMNFYDDTDETPFLPRSKIVDVLKGIDLPSQRWPVPEAYWYHPLFDKDWDPIPRHVGRVLQ